MKRTLLIILAFSLGLNAGLGWYLGTARKHAPGRQGPPPRENANAGRTDSSPTPGDTESVINAHLATLHRDLGLDDAQVSALRALLGAKMPEMAVLLHRTTEANRRISDAYAVADLDTVRFRELVAAASAARTRADSLSSVILLAEADILTPQQRTKFAHTAPVAYSMVRRDPQPRADGPPPRREDRNDPPPREEERR